MRERARQQLSVRRMRRSGCCTRRSRTWCRRRRHHLRSTPTGIRKKESGGAVESGARLGQRGSRARISSEHVRVSRHVRHVTRCRRHLGRRHKRICSRLLGARGNFLPPSGGGTSTPIDLTRHPATSSPTISCGLGHTAMSPETPTLAQPLPSICIAPTPIPSTNPTSQLK